MAKFMLRSVCAYKKPKDSVTDWLWEQAQRSLPVDLRNLL